MPYNFPTCQGINGRFVCPKRAAVQLTPGFLGRVLANQLGSGFFGVEMKDIVDEVFVSSSSLNDGCFYCGSRATEWDHIVPKSKGGKDKYNNLIPACSWCNGRKRDKTLSEFRRYLKENGKYSEFDTPCPIAVHGKVYFLSGLFSKETRFISDDGRVVLESSEEYHSRIPKCFTAPRRSP